MRTQLRGNRLLSYALKLPRAQIEWLIDELINHLDCLDTPADFEVETDRCDAWDDCSSALLADHYPGSPEDAEPEWDACPAGDDLGTAILSAYPSTMKRERGAYDCP